MRIAPIWLINIILVILYATEKYLLMGGLDWSNLFKSLLWSGNMVDNGWYLQTIVLFYFLFYLAMKKGSNDKQVALITTLGIIFYLIISIRTEMPKHWYVSSLAFASGLFFAILKSQFDQFSVSRYRTVMVMAITSFTLLFIYQFVHPEGIGIISKLNLLASLTYGVAFVGVVVVVMMKFYISGNIVKELSPYYLEIYTIQGFIFNMLRNEKWSISNDWTFAILSFIFTILMAITLKPMFLKITQAVRR